MQEQLICMVRALKIVNRISIMSTKFEEIAQRKLLLKKISSNTQEEIVVKLGKPYWVDEGIEAACPVVIENFLNEQKIIVGVDFINAIESALKFVDSYLSGRESEYIICWLDGEPYFD